MFESPTSFDRPERALHSLKSATQCSCVETLRRIEMCCEAIGCLALSGLVGFCLIALPGAVPRADLFEPFGAKRFAKLTQLTQVSPEQARQARRLLVADPNPGTST